MLSKASEYAIRSLVYVALRNREQERPGYREVAREIEAPEQFTAKILQTLVRQGLLLSIRGRGGGFFFDDKAKDLPLIEVIHAMEGYKLFTRCGIGLSQCSDTAPCPIHHQYASIRDQYQQLATQTTIQMLADRIAGGEAVLNRLAL
ncbi:RrF2 family transcriptional regulator [Geofilum rhodophaeum]|uniref:RrF2 family transcriptional regulator n=1 Tax=Geofilum rhodophaeum TaxID=1965019 RepID=UPI000B5211A2|nr:Rrf2 family transcriptional regulator [Geofilum rhodophaeum]HHU58707.1 Rrf2 family transcriptional regulator [Bacteroidales bacterium]